MQQIFLQCARGAFIALFLMATNNANGASMLRYLFGSQPVSQEVQKVSDIADRMTNFETSVFDMNWFAKQLGYSSFNWFNTTWVDEEVVSAKPKNRLLWQLIHEKYHTIASHDWQRVVGICALAAPILRGMMHVGAGYFQTGDLPIMPYLIPNELPSVLLTLFLFLWHEEYCEGQANEFANYMMSEGILTGDGVDRTA